MFQRLACINSGAPGVNQLVVRGARAFVADLLVVDSVATERRSFFLPVLPHTWHDGTVSALCHMHGTIAIARDIKDKKMKDTC